MASMDLLIAALDSAVWELSEAFKDFPDSDVWKRPDPRLLSAGELAAHIAYWEAESLLGGGFESPLVNKAADYYTSHVGQPFELNLGAEAVYAEVKRVHEACKAALVASPHDSEQPCSNRDGWTWGYTLQYQVFHVAYHTGQVYSVRHLLGHETPDN
ncbi:MAG: DinB family protein [Fimbriimonadaceae bacterium]|nr:DinB family protein [Fimbriimonadaceae bacterium]QYK55408.1 MAG: DinB family protein [Fimbriimonadaceae bacterium]